MLVTFYFSSQGKKTFRFEFVCQKPFCLSFLCGRGCKITVKISQPTVSSHYEPWVLLEHFSAFSLNKKNKIKPPCSKSMSSEKSNLWLYSPGTHNGVHSTLLGGVGHLPSLQHVQAGARAGQRHSTHLLPGGESSI